MRWKLVLAVPAMLLIVNATIATAQDVPVTVTLEPDHPIYSVTLYDHVNNSLGATVFRPDTGKAVQTFVGTLTLNSATNRFDMTAEVVIGGADNTVAKGAPSKKRKKEPKYAFSFGPEDHCPTGATNSAVRIACSAVKHGAGLVCTAFYQHADLGTPGDTCGSHACVYCQRIKVCGANPVCP
jgi:hypothetical protein